MPAGVGVEVNVGVGVAVRLGVTDGEGVAVGGTGVEEGAEASEGIVAVADGLVVAASEIRNSRLTSVTSATSRRSTAPCMIYPLILRIDPRSIAAQ
jgi:hypothetical protein